MKRSNSISNEVSKIPVRTTQSSLGLYIKIQNSFTCHFHFRNCSQKSNCTPWTESCWTFRHLNFRWKPCFRGNNREFKHFFNCCSLIFAELTWKLAVVWCFRLFRNRLELVFRPLLQRSIHFPLYTFF